MPGPLGSPELDFFNRPDENPLIFPWATPIQAGGGGAQITSNAASSGTAYYTYPGGTDGEVFGLLSVLPANDDGGIAFYIRTNKIGSAGIDAYRVIFRIASGVQELLLFRQEDGTSNFLNSATPTVAAGDSVAITAIGSSLVGWTKAAAGSWTQVVTATDSTFMNGGYIGFGTSNTSRLDSFGASPILGGSSPIKYGMSGVV